MAMTTSAELGIRMSNFCDSVEKELVSRCINVFRFEPHSRRKILIILGNVTVTIIPVSGKVERQITEDFKKPICLLGLSNSTNSEKIAKEILTMCPFIDHSMLHSLVEAIDELKSREYDQNGLVISKESPDSTFLPRFPEFFDDFGNNPNNELEESCSEPDFGKLDHYIDQLYEDISQKIEASRCLSKLSECNSYLKDISRHDSALNALFRTLREDSKKSSILTKNILSICWNMAKIKNFHGLLINTHKIPMLILEIINFELERCEKWKSQLIEHDAIASKNVTTQSLDECNAMWVRLTELTTFQNGVLHIAFQIIYCLSEDKRVRECLVQHKVITSLNAALERRDNDLLEVTTAFLNNLSSFKQCIDEITEGEVVDNLAALLKEGSPIPKKIVGNCLYLFYNLSFSGQLRQTMMDCGLIAIIANCFDKPLFREITVKTLYVFSMDPKFRIKFTKAPLIDSLMTYLTTDNDPSTPDSVATVVGSLILNLSRSKRGAKLIWETNKLGSLITMALNAQDSFLMKIIRSLAEHDVAFILYEFAGEIATTMTFSGIQEFVMECIGILSCLDLTQVSIQSVVLKGKLFPWLKQTLGYYVDELYNGGMSVVTFDLTRASVDVILLLTNICSIEEGAKLVISEGFMDTLLKILLLGGKNKESVIDHVFYYFETCTKYESVSKYLATKTRIPNGLLEFAEGSTGKLRQKSLIILEQIGKFDDMWKENVEQFNFLSWNKEWTDVIMQNEIGDASGSEMQFRFAQDSCVRSRNAICSLYDTSNSDETSDDNDEHSPWLMGNNTYGDTDVFEMFRQQFENETGLNNNNWGLVDSDPDEFWIGSTSDSGSD